MIKNFKYNCYTLFQMRINLFYAHRLRPQMMSLPRAMASRFRMATHSGSNCGEKKRKLPVFVCCLKHSWNRVY